MVCIKWVADGVWGQWCHVQPLELVQLAPTRKGIEGCLCMNFRMECLSAWNGMLLG
jgi:hypothetical protein